MCVGFINSCPCTARMNQILIFKPTEGKSRPGPMCYEYTTMKKLKVVSLPTVATGMPPRSTTLGNSSNEGPRALTVSNSLIDNCGAETRIDHQVDDDDERVSSNSVRTINGLDSSNSSDGGSSESNRSNNKSRKRSRSPSVNRRCNFKKPTSRRYRRWCLIN